MSLIVNGAIGKLLLGVGILCLKFSQNSLYHYSDI